MPTKAIKKRLNSERRERTMRQLAKFAARATDRPDGLEALLGDLDDGWEQIREKVITLAGERGEWAGYPIPSEYAKLVIEARHPLHDSLNGAWLGKDEKTDEDIQVVNQWIDHGRERVVYLYREAGGRVQHAVLPTYQSTRRARLMLDTLAASQVWSVQAEFTALARLKTLVTPTAFRYYLLTGTFLETSSRSKVIYLFRKCRPTLAIGMSPGGDDTKTLAALCLHPIGYYEGTFAGSMVPTDDVIAHLLMMRGDERKFWSKCNQHDARLAEAGV